LQHFSPFGLPGAFQVSVGGLFREAGPGGTRQRIGSEGAEAFLQVAPPWAAT
jgi:hypothetical protein